MGSKAKEILKKALAPKNRIKLFVVIGIVGVLLILLSEVLPQNSQSESASLTGCEISYSDYVEELEDKTQNIISSINGVGECKVMITLKDTNESVYAKNSSEKTDDGSYSQDYEYVLYELNGEDTPVLVKQNFPKIQGVVVVCQGGDNVEIKEQIVNSITSLFDVSSSKVSVSKLE